MVDIIRAPVLSDDVVVVCNSKALRIHANERQGNDIEQQDTGVEKRKGERRAVAGRIVNEQAFVELENQARSRGYQEGLERGLEEGTARGQEQGYADGEKHAQRSYENQLTNLIDTLSALVEVRDDYIASQKGMVVKIAALAIARLLGESLAKESGIVQAVETVITEVKKDNPMTVLVAQKDFAVVERYMRQKYSVDPARIQVAPSEDVELGGCLIVTPEGNIDGRVEVRLQMLVDTINAVFAQQFAESSQHDAG